MGGCNNNPTQRQLITVYKRLLIHSDLTDNITGNCTPLELIPILNVSSYVEPSFQSMSSILINNINGTNPKIRMASDEVIFQLEDVEDSDIKLIFDK